MRQRHGKAALAYRVYEGRCHGLTPLPLLYTDRHGHPHQQEFIDFVARIVQHEFDHLQGTVFLDRVESTQELMTEQEYQKYELV